jgi:tetratricopeptide (TPR) repeat protein
LAAVDYYRNRYAAGIRWTDRAIEEAENGGARDALAEAYKFRDLLLWESGQSEKATHGELALEIYGELGDLRNQASVLNNMGAIAHDSSRWEESSQLYRHGLDIAERIGDQSLGAIMKYNLVEILIDRGLLDEAEPLIREVTRLWRAAGAEADVAEANRELARLLARRAVFDEARELLDGARAYQARAGKMAEVLRTEVRRIELLLLEQRSVEALDLATDTQLVATVTDGGAVVETSLTRLRGCALLQLGRLEEARNEFDRALERARQRVERLEQALTLDAWIQLAELAGEPAEALRAVRSGLFGELAISAAPPFATGLA